MENENAQRIVRLPSICEQMDHGFNNSDYVLIMKLFLYEVFATIITWTITNVVRSVYRNYFSLTPQPQQAQQLESQELPDVTNRTVFKRTVTNGNDSPVFRISVSGDCVCTSNEEESQKTSGSNASRDSSFSCDDSAAWEEVGCSLYSIGSADRVKFAEMNDSSNSSEVVKAVIDFDECSEKVPQFVYDDVRPNKPDERTCLNSVKLSKIKESLRLSKEEDEKIMHEIQKKLRSLKLDEKMLRLVDEDGDVKCCSSAKLKKKDNAEDELGINKCFQIDITFKSVKKVDEVGDVKCISSGSLSREGSKNELGVNVKDIDMYTIEYNDSQREEIKEQFSSPI